MTSSSSDSFGKKETEERMQAALKGARISGHKPMSEIVPQRGRDRAKPKQSKAPAPKKK